MTVSDGVALNAEGFQNGFMLSMMLLVSVSLNVKNEVTFLNNGLGCGIGRPVSQWKWYWQACKSLDLVLAGL
jgi:hypothetical protein